MKFLTKAALGLLTIAFVAAPAFAAPLVNGEVDAFWWANDYNSAPTTAQTAIDEGSDAPGFEAQLWFVKRYGFRASRYSSDIDMPGSSIPGSDSTSLDFMWKAFAPTEQNFIAVGLGWQDLDLATIGLADNTSGARLTAEGKLTFLPVLHAYAQGSYYPSLDDVAGTTGNMFRDMKGLEYEFGVAWKVAPLFHLRAGYRSSSVDFVEQGATSGDVESKGFLLGAGIHF